MPLRQRSTPGQARTAWGWTPPVRHSTQVPAHTARFSLPKVYADGWHDKPACLEAIPLSLFLPPSPAATPGIEEEREWGDITSAPPLATAGRGSQMALLKASQAGDVLELNCGDGNDVISNLLDSNEEEDDTFTVLGRAVQLPAPAASSAGDECGTPVTPPSSPVLLDVCKCSAAWLDVPWPAAVAEALL